MGYIIHIAELSFGSEHTWARNIGLVTVHSDLATSLPPKEAQLAFVPVQWFNTKTVADELLNAVTMGAPITTVSANRSGPVTGIVRIY